MNNDVLIEVESVSKKFCRSLKRSLWYGLQDIGAELLGRSRGTELRMEEFWAVRDVSFTLSRGECLGLIGHNGAGKSTLLKMLNGLIKPDAGSITMKGRVGALIELGTGFNPILTGRENIYNNGAVLGFTKKEIDQKFDAIVAFSEMEEFIDTPVQNYSSGMKVRLGFAIAAQMEPDILLIDEVLAVGDVSFVLKCFSRMDALLPNTAIILVSHNISQIARMCNRLLLLKRGKTMYAGSDVPEGINHYYSMLEKPQGSYLGSDAAILEDVVAKSGEGERNGEIYVDHGEALIIDLKIRLNQPISRANIYLAFHDSTYRNFAEAQNFIEFIPDLNKGIGTYHFEAHFPQIEFAQGFYSVTVVMTDLSDDKRRIIFRKQSAVHFTVRSKHHGWAPIQFQPEWRVLEQSEIKRELYG